MRRMSASSQQARPPRRLRLCAALAATLSLSFVSSPQAQTPTTRYSFAVVANTLQNPADEAPTQRLISAIGRDPGVSFIVYGGNLKSAREACQDALYERRHALLEAARAPLILVPGQHDWIECGKAGANSFDPVERLDFLRQTLFASSTSMGQNPIALVRESEIARFRPYRENVRWQTGNTVFISLNIPGANNHYLNAGGRNGEFEDRTVANAFWLAHAAEYAKRRGARAIVVFIQGNPNLERYEQPDRFKWLRFAAHTQRDGYLEFKRNLLKLAQVFHGPVVLIHPNSKPIPGGFTIDQPLRNNKGVLVANLTRITFAPEDRLNQWLQIDADATWHPPFRVSVRNVPKHMPLLSLPASPATDGKNDGPRPLPPRPVPPFIPEWNTPEEPDTHEPPAMLPVEPEPAQDTDSTGKQERTLPSLY
ncbi:hypothetical protein QS306_06175 [Paraburkholderia bonniea]|uniref:hypothetical protein n=1 Tax=Paraburkholderia bonniea TaxID=2152891 RepID=UPI002574097C|nr:hypothetical protein [Paraburkholderia bonniea]WJF91218.1 hypothetical protein QS306_06175 [Paraburkholderia bonniea]WJF94532.1 hypothetical protein QS308_06180 [Paraburkholderia bonniea]